MPYTESEGAPLVDGDGDVLLEQVRQLLAGGRTVEPGHRAADIFLVLHEPVRRRLRVRLVANGRNDVVACPHDVVGP